MYYGLISIIYSLFTALNAMSFVFPVYPYCFLHPAWELIVFINDYSLLFIDNNALSIASSRYE